MEKRQIRWCFRLKGGLMFMEPSTRLSKSYMQTAKSSLEGAEKDFNDGDLLWATVKIYYSEYYALYSFLQRIGIKCENHACSILAVGLLLGEDRIKAINEHKEKRIDAQYYMKVDRDEAVSKMLQEAKLCVALFDEQISNLKQADIDTYRQLLQQAIKP